MLAIVDDEDGTISSFFPKIVRSIQIECLKTNFVVVLPKNEKVVVEYVISIEFDEIDGKYGKY